MRASGATCSLLLAAAAVGGLGCSISAQTGGTGGAVATETAGASGADANTSAGLEPGSCTPGVANPDSQPGGACAADCQSVSCGKTCTVDCCTSCGPNGEGQKICSCPNPGGPYTNCACVMPGDVSPYGLGPCSPQGYSTATVPADAPAGSISLRGVACSKTNVACFTADSTLTSPRACICMADGTLHCAGLSHDWPHSGAPTTYN